MVDFEHLMPYEYMWLWIIDDFQSLLTLNYEWLLIMNDFELYMTLNHGWLWIMGKHWIMGDFRVEITGRQKCTHTHTHWYHTLVCNMFFYRRHRISWPMRIVILIPFFLAVNIFFLRGSHIFIWGGGTKFFLVFFCGLI